MCSCWQGVIESLIMSPPTLRPTERKMWIVCTQRSTIFAIAYILLCFRTHGLKLSDTKGHQSPSVVRIPGMIALASLAVSGLLLENPTPALAFDNAVKRVSTPKTAGPKPAMLGLDKKGKLRACMKPSPNCFSTTPDSMSANAEEVEEKDETISDIHVIMPWKYTNGDPSEAFGVLKKVVSNYEPGHDNIDGGGFKIIKEDDTKRYLYVQFESLRRGFIDDLEICVNNDSSVQLVSSSRLGYLDFQVNAIRLNYLAEKLRTNGFEATAITQETHPTYFDSNPL